MPNELTSALTTLCKYVMDNVTVDHFAISKTLHKYGYVERKWGNRFYRALSHTDEYAGDVSLGEYVAYLRKHPHFEKGDAEGFCDNIHNTIDYIGGCIHINNYYNGVWLHHTEDTPFNDLKSIWVVYEVTAPTEAILWSMDALKDFIPKLDEEQAKLVKYFLEHYGHDHEIVIDTNHVTIIDVHLYDSTEHELEYNREYR